MYYPLLDYARHTHAKFDVNETMITDVLENSKGQPIMSDEDVKLAILSLYNTCLTQQKLINELVECVNELRSSKKRFWNRK